MKEMKKYSLIEIVFFILALACAVIFIVFLYHISISFSHFIDKDNKLQQADSTICNISRYELDVYSYDASALPSKAAFNNQTLIIQQLDSISKILDNQNKYILQRQEDLIADIRQETNNNLDKMSAWLAFWLGMIAILGVFIPFAFQYYVYKRDISRIKEIEKKSRIISSEQSIKLLTRCIDDINSLNVIEAGEMTNKALNLTLSQIKNHLRQLYPLDKIVPEEEDVSFTKARLISIGIILFSTLNGLIRRGDGFEIHNIQRAQDNIRMILRNLCELNEIMDERCLEDYARQLSTSLDIISFRE